MEMEKLLGQMTLKEKVGQLNQRLYGWQCYEKTELGIVLTEYFKSEVKRWDSLGIIYGVFRSDPWSGRNRETGLNKQEAFQVATMIQDYLKTRTRLGIPAFLAEECPHGHQALESTTMPTNISVGASWNPELYGQVQEVVAEELREKGGHLGLISVLDVARDPRWGRTEECFSEDPYLTAAFAISGLRGFQGTDKEQIPTSKGLMVLKHFAAQGSTMGGHNAGPVSIGDSELRDIHLYPMQEAVKHGAQLTMAAYNDLDGIPCHGNPDLLNGILRQEFGFDGAVMADGCALDRLVPLVESAEAAATWALESGVDISLWDNVFPYLEQAVLGGQVLEEVLDRAVLRVLRLKEKMGLFQNPVPVVKSRPQQEKDQLNLELATESVVLIKNEGDLLPLDINLPKVALIGPNADYLYNQLGDYTPFKDEDSGFTLYEGIRDVFKGDLLYAKGSHISEAIPDGISEAREIGAQADVLILALGGSSTRDFGTVFDANGAALGGSKEMTSGENIDLADISLPVCQLQLVKELKQLGKPMIGILIQGRPHSLTELVPLLDGILIAGYPGEQGGLALAKLLFGLETPSGKLAMSIPRSSMQLPVYYNYRAAAFAEDYADGSGKALYPFGFGLSYAKFSLHDVELVGNTVVGRLKNESGRAASEVVQVYVRSKIPKVIPRVKELKGFAKIKLVAGEEKTFSIPLASVGDYLFVEATDFKLKIDGSFR